MPQANRRRALDDLSRSPTISTPKLDRAARAPALDDTDFESLVGELTARFIRAASVDLDRALEDALAEIGAFLQADRSFLVSFPDGQEGYRSHLWTSPTTRILNETSASLERYAFIAERMKAGHPLVLRSLDDLPPQAANERAYAERVGLAATAMFPLMVEGEVLGCFGLDSAVELEWSEARLGRLRSLGEILASAIARARARDDLEERLRFEQLLLRLSQRLNGATADTIDGELTEGLRLLGEHIGADRSFYVTVEEEEARVKLAWFAPGEPVDHELLEMDYAARFPWSTPRLREGEPMVLRVAELPPEAAAEIEYTRSRNLAIGLVVPVLDGGVPAGVLFLDRHEKAPHWTPRLATRLQVAAELYAAALERTRLERLTRRSEARFRGMFESSPNGIAVCSEEGLIEEANPRLGQLLDCGTDRLLGRAFRDHLHSEDREEWSRQLQATLRDPSSLANLECRLARSGEDLWIQLRATRFLHPEQDAPRVLVVMQDITERRLGEAKLQASVQEIRRLKDRLAKDNLVLREQLTQQSPNRIIGDSATLQTVLEQAGRVAPTDTTVLLTGETGTGKDLLARIIHEKSARADRPMVKVNCAALPSSLVESELFGRERGAYTGAMTRQVGRFEYADGSTIFLDEVGELPLDLQAKLLRVLEDGELERLGSNQTRTVDVRVLAATNRDLEVAVEEGRFRADLFFRLSVFPLRVPALRERSDDIPALAWAFVRELGEPLRKHIESISSASMKRLQAHSWPGNVRELRNVIERGLILSEGPELEVTIPAAAISSTLPGRTLDEVQRRHVLAVLEESGWRIRGPGGAAEILDVKPTTLEARMKKLGIERPG